MEKILFISPSTPCRKNWTMFGASALICIIVFWYINSLNVEHKINAVALFCLGCIILIVCITPYKFILTKSHLIIKRHLKDCIIPLQNIKSIHLMNPAEKKKYYMNDAWNPLGAFVHYPTNYKKIIPYAYRFDNWTLLVTDRGKFLITPNDLQLIDATLKQIENVAANTDNLEIYASANNWRKFIPIGIIAPVFFLVFFSYREPKYVPDSNALKLKGIYGVNIPFADIVEADTISWNKMPGISIRTNGISLFKVHRGKFKTADDKKIHLSITSQISPIIRIVDKNGAIYYINRKNTAETEKMIIELKNR